MVWAWQSEWSISNASSGDNVPGLSRVDHHVIVALALHRHFVVERSSRLLPLPVTEDVGFVVVVVVIVGVGCGDGGTEARRLAQSLPGLITSAAAAAAATRIRYVMATRQSTTERIRSTSVRLRLVRQYAYRTFLITLYDKTAHSLSRSK